MRRAVGTQEMARLLGVKPHVLRYWEQEIPLIAPNRDTGGRKVYREQDLRLLHRIRHLVIEKKYTVQGALERILEEASPEQAPQKAAFEGLRADLLTLRSRIATREQAPVPATQAPDAAPVEPEPTAGAVEPEPAPAVGPKRSETSESGPGEPMPAQAPWALEYLAPERLIDAPKTAPEIILRRRVEPLSSYFREAGAEMVREGELLLVTVSHLFLSPRDATPAECVPVWPESHRSLLQGAMERSRALAYRLGRPVRWLHLVWDRFIPAVENHLNSYPAIYRPELLAVPGSEARDQLASPLRPLSTSPYATVLGWLRGQRRYPALIHFHPLEEVSAPFLDEELLAIHLAEGTAASARACDRAAGRWRLSGGMIYSSDTLREVAVPLEATGGAADIEERQVSWAHLFAAVGGVAVPAPGRCLKPGRYDHAWPGEVEALIALLFRGWCEEAGRPPVREIDPLFAEGPEELVRRRGERDDKKGESSNR